MREEWRDGQQRWASAFRQCPQAAVWPVSDSLPGPDGRIRTGPETYERKGDADRALSLVESDIKRGRVD